MVCFLGFLVFCGFFCCCCLFFLGDGGGGLGFAFERTTKDFFFLFG